jgi:hypothetical protein
MVVAGVTLPKNTPTNMAHYMSSIQYVKTVQDFFLVPTKKKQAAAPSGFIALSNCTHS